jgi:hypothetical protein
VVNPLASVKPFESLVHTGLIGWRLPSALVQSYAEQAKEQIGSREDRRDRQAA